jgi:P4 family phage/plasmid primase-like protien
MSGELNKQVLAKLDIRAAAVALGVKFVVQEPNTEGWLPCRAVDREDQHASAAINICTGYYSDLGSPDAKAITFFDLAVKLGRFADWRQARDHYARQVGVEVPRDGEQQRQQRAPADQVLWLGRSANDDVLWQKWCAKKPGIVPESLVAFGARKCRWPIHRDIEDQFMCWGLTGRSGRKDDDSPPAVLLMRINAEDFPAVGSLQPRKTHLVRGSRDSWLWPGDAAALTGAEVIVKVEGPTDAMSLWPLLPTGSLVIANVCGAAARPDRLAMDFAKDKTVIVVGDADEPGQAGARRFARAFAHHARDVKLVQLPYEITKSKGKDLRDWVAEGNILADFQALIEAAEIVDLNSSEENHRETNSASKKKRTSKEPSVSGVLESDDDPHRLAQMIIDERYSGSDGLWLRYWRQDFYAWRQPDYERLSEAEFRARVSIILKGIFDREWLGKYAGMTKDVPVVEEVTTSLVTNVLEALAGRCLVPFGTEQPAWLDGRAPFPPTEILVARNALLHLPSLVCGKPCLLKPRPDFFTTNALGYEFNAEATCPQWLEFLQKLWPDDHESHGLLSEWAGYLLLPDTSLDTLLMVIGPPRSGKGTVARVLSALIGRGNVIWPTLGSLQSAFGLAPFIGKTLVIFADARLSGRADVAMIVERILSISGGDEQTIPRKYREDVTMRLPTRFMIISNELPSLRDASGALMTRTFILRFTRSWLGGEDRQLTGKLLEELPGILNWAIAGWERLRRRGRFIQPTSGQELVDDLEALTSPIRAFLRERCRVGVDQEVAVADLFVAWQMWCRMSGREHTGTVQSFGKDLRAAVPDLRVVRPRQDGDRPYVYQGIGLRQG